MFKKKSVEVNVDLELLSDELDFSPVCHLLSFEGLRLKQLNECCLFYLDGKCTFFIKWLDYFKIMFIDLKYILHQILQMHN